MISTQDARATLSRPNRFQRNQQILKQKRRKSYYRHYKSVRRLRYNTRLHYQLTNAFLGKCVLGLSMTGIYNPEHCFIITETRSTPESYRSAARRMTLNPHAPIFKPTNCSRLFTIYRPELLTEMDASTSQDIIDLTVPAKSPKTSSECNNSTVSEQLHLLTTQVNQLRKNSEPALEQTKPLIQNFPLANINQFQYLHAVQHQVAQFFVDLNSQKKERLKLHATIRELENELAQLRRQINEPSPSSIPAPFTVDPPSSAAFQDHSTLGTIEVPKLRLTITLKKTSSTTSRSQLTDSPQAPQSTQTASGLPSDLETRVKQMEEEITKARYSRETIISIYRAQFAFLYDKIRALQSGGTDTISWKLTSLKIVFNTAKSSARLDNAAKDPSTHYNSPVYRTHPYDYIFFVQFYPYGLDSAAGNHASIMFALFPGDYDGLLTWPFPKTIQLSVRDQLDPQNTWTITFAPSEKISFRSSTGEALPTLMNFNFFPHSRMFSKTENFLLNDILYLEIKFTDIPSPEGATPFTFRPSLLKNPPNQFSILLTPVSCRVIANT